MLLQEKQFEKPANGMYIGVIADVIEKLNVPNLFKPGTTTNKLVICWVLDKLDAQGSPLMVFKSVNAVLHEKSTLVKEVLRPIFSTSIPKPFDSEKLLGHTNQLMIVQETNDQGKVFVNVKAILPLPAGAQVPVIPAGFVRAKDKKPSASPMAPPTSLIPTESEDIVFA